MPRRHTFYKDIKIKRAIRYTKPAAGDIRGGFSIFYRLSGRFLPETPEEWTS
jgi:hypothetical protein